MRITETRLIPSIALVALVLTLCESAAAERDPSEKFRYSVHVGSGVAGILHEDLNKELESAGFGKLKNPYVPFGVSMLTYSGRFVFGVGLNLLFYAADEVAREDTRGRASAMAAAIRLGYEVVALESFSVTPLIGFGISDLMLTFYSKDNQRFDDVLEQQSGGVYIEGMGLLLDFALRLEYRVALSESEDRRFDFAFGLVGGFHYTPAILGWTQSGYGDLKDGPDAGVTGPYGLITIGIASSSFPVEH